MFLFWQSKTLSLGIATYSTFAVESFKHTLSFWYQIMQQ